MDFLKLKNQFPVSEGCHDTVNVSGDKMEEYLKKSSLFEGE
jgi:hypothetical protein